MIIQKSMFNHNEGVVRTYKSRGGGRVHLVCGNWEKTDLVTSLCRTVSVRNARVSLRRPREIDCKHCTRLIKGIVRKYAAEHQFSVKTVEELVIFGDYLLDLSEAGIKQAMFVRRLNMILIDRGNK